MAETKEKTTETRTERAAKKSVNQRLSPKARTRTGARVLKPLRPAHSEYR